MLTACPEIRVRTLGARFVPSVAVLSGFMMLLGLLLTRVLVRTWPLSGEDGIDTLLAAHRSGWANAVTNVLCDIANTFGAAAAALIAVCWARWRCRRWAEALFVAFSVLLELSVFLITTVVVHRARPAGLELDASPPTSSFPSGHTAAAVALYGAVAVVAYRRTSRRSSWLLLLMPAAVGFARLYRGMHHPSDVGAGVVLGALCILLADRCVRAARGGPEAEPESPAVAATQANSVPLSATATEPRHAAAPDVLIVNGSKAQEGTVRRIAEIYGALCAKAGRPVPRVVTTSADDHGAGAAADAVRAGARLVVACGGDGTVSEVAGALVGTDTALGIVPLGTGNLLAANLGLPDTLEGALAVLIEGTERRIDVGRLSDRIFLGMAGIGLDAAMVRDAPEGLKRRAGWAAYALAVARHLPDRISAVSVHIDGRGTRHRDVSMVLIGNIGRLQAGFEPLPHAQVDDGLLDVAVVAPHGPFGWLRAAAALRGGREGRREDRAARVVHRDRGSRITISTRRPVACEADGETLEPTSRLDVEVWRAALRVRVGAAPAGPNARSGAREGASVAAAADREQVLR